MAKQQEGNKPLPDVQGAITDEIKRYQHLADNTVKRADRADAAFAVKLLTELRDKIFHPA
jgi:hypothetical protein